MSENKIKIHADADAVNRELEALAKEFAEKKSQLVPAFFDAIDRFSEGGAIDIKQGAASDAFNVFLVFEFTDSFRDFVAAFRAGDFSVE